MLCLVVNSPVDCLDKTALKMAVNIRQKLDEEQGCHVFGRVYKVIGAHHAVPGPFACRAVEPGFCRVQQTSHAEAVAVTLKMAENQRGHFRRDAVFGPDKFNGLSGKNAFISGLAVLEQHLGEECAVGHGRT